MGTANELGIASGQDVARVKAAALVGAAGETGAVEAAAAEAGVLVEAAAAEEGILMEAATYARAAILVEAVALRGAMGIVRAICNLQVAGSRVATSR